MASANREIVSLTSAILVSDEEKRYRENYERGLPRVEGITTKKLNCTVCNINIKHRLVTSRNVHLSLDVLVCNTCSHFYRLRCINNEITSRCRWCAKDKDLISCKRCTRKFCRTCMFKHSHRINSNEWTCFLCNPMPLWSVRALCAAAFSYSEKLKTDLEQRRNRRSSNSSRNLQSDFIVFSSPRRTRSRTTELLTQNKDSSTSAAGNVLTSPKFKSPVHPTRKTSTEANVCIMCLDKRAQIAFVPCGHLCLCEDCLPGYQRSFNYKCPICRQMYINHLKIH